MEGERERWTVEALAMTKVEVWNVTEVFIKQQQLQRLHSNDQNDAQNFE